MVKNCEVRERSGPRPVCSMHVWYPSPATGLVRDVGTHDGDSHSARDKSSHVNPFEGCFVYSVIKG
jgi:hypothetical protein